MEMMSIENVTELRDAMKAARNDDTPYMAVADDEIHVFGDPNKTEIKSANYTVRFLFPNTSEWKKRAEMNGDRIVRETDDGRLFLCEREYKNVYLSPRNIGSAVSSLVQIESFLFDITEDGELKDLSLDEMQRLMSVMRRDLSNETYDLVASVLHIPYDEIEWMQVLNTMENAIKIVYNNPSAVNEADLFFGSSPRGD